MKNRSLNYTFIIILILATGWLVWVFLFQSRQTPITPKSQTLPLHKEERSLDSPAQETIIREFTKEGNVPVELWGKVCDQDGNPVVGARVSYGWNYGVLGKWDPGTKTDTKTSDVNGMFHIEEMGYVMGISDIKKEGYKFAAGQKTSFGYSHGTGNYVPDRNVPQILLLIKQDLLPALLHYEREYLLSWDGKTVRYDLMSGRMSDTGELMVTLSRGEVNQEGGYDWSFSLQLEGGGIAQTNVLLRTLAPSDGYKPSWTCDRKSAKRGGGEYYLFIKTADGKYGLLNYSIYADPERNHNVYLTTLINPVPGNRILEHVPSKAIEIE